MQRTIAVSLSLGLILIASFAVYAQTEKDVIGTWKLDAQRSSFTGRNAPNEVVIRFEQAGGLLRETIKVVNAAGESTRTIAYALDGSETVSGSGDERVKTRILHTADAIVLQWIDDGGTFTRTLKLSNDRRVLSIKAHDANRDGQSDDLIVLERQ
ncbi:MAG TPA: hypothetical protein VKD91_20070 [Pyrinomonadaceae bacterium]|nr:hypothetical protein [Pyrinomonadaceae bacterium]